MATKKGDADDKDLDPSERGTEAEAERGLDDLELSEEELARLDEGQTGDVVEARQREEAGEREGEPQTLEELREQLRDERLRARKQQRAFRKRISQLRGQARTQAALQPQQPAAAAALPEPEIKDDDLEFDATGKPTLKKEAVARLRAQIRQQPAQQVQQPIREEAAQLSQQAADYYSEIRDDYVARADDPDLAEDAVRYLEGAYRWLDGEFRRELESGAQVPRGEDALLEFLDDAGLAEEFRDRFPDVSMESLVEAPRSRRKFQSFVDGYLKGDGERERPARRRREREEDDDLRPPIRRRPEASGLRRPPGIRSMARRGAGERRAETGAPGIRRYTEMPVEDFLALPREEIQKIDRLARQRRPRTDRPEARR